jgi:hypothetical protein
MSNSPQSLDDIFNGNEEKVQEPETQETEELEVEEPESEEPTAEKEPEAPAASQESENESWTKSAVLDERRKRQALEAELEELRRSKQEPEKVPDVIDDQAGYTDYVSNKVKAEISQARIEMSQEFMRMQDSEYDIKEAEFLEMAKDNPQLAKEVLNHSMPAKFVVETVNKARELKKLENVDEYKAQLRAEVEAEIRKELNAEIEAKKEKDDKVASIKPSLANARASKDQGEPTRQSLDDLFGR